MSKRISGVPFDTVREYEVRHRAAARLAAAQGFVLLKNEGGLLPLSLDAPAALYGSGSVFPIKGGSGSGDVNSRDTVSLWEGMKNNGFVIANEDWLARYKEEYLQCRSDWRDAIWKKMDEPGGNLWTALMELPFVPPTGAAPVKGGEETAVFVLSRTAGEGADRFAEQGDWYLTEEEEEFLKQLDGMYPHIVLLLNIGGLVDLSFLEKYPHIESVLLISQPGMEAGNAAADALCGKTVPSGKLTDSWALHYEDYPNSASFAHNNGNVEQERYEEGIFVGYRYFDTFEVPVLYDFGFGLSYTDFQMEWKDMRQEGSDLIFTAAVKNTGTKYSGREVVQIYAACPQEKELREYRRLIGYQKTRELAPGEVETLSVRVPASALACYDTALPGWVIRQGTYGIFAGNSLLASKAAAGITVAEDIILEKTQHICPLQEELKEIQPDAEAVKKRRSALLEKLADLPNLVLDAGAFAVSEPVYDGAYEDTPEEVRSFVDTLTLDQLVMLSTGDLAAGQGSLVGSAGSRVPGSAAQTSPCAEEQGLEDIVLADGPAGLRLNREYRMKDGFPVKEPFEKSILNGYLYRGEETGGETYYQFCTAIPVGTLLAQSWDPENVRACGRLVAEEMLEFGVTLWLAPGMNIHRNPLCGRNFEYFAEDPLLAGEMAAAMTEGVEAVKGCGVTIKHFACNNQEDNRMASDSILSERTLREIYLKGFEIAVRKAQPASIMTSYNLINGVHAANCFDTCTKAARCEWGYQGLIMTDWTTTNVDDRCTAAGCMRAGNDIVMPGQPMDHENIRAELENGTLDIKDLKRSAARIVNTVWKYRAQ